VAIVVTTTAKRRSNLARNFFIAFVAAGALLLFASARAQSIALPVAGMIALLLPAPALLLRRWRRPPLYLLVGAVYALLAGIVRLAGNDVTTIVSVGFALAAFLLLGAAIAISTIGDTAAVARAKAELAPTAIDAFVVEAISARGLRVLASVAMGLALLAGLSAGAPGLVWGSHAIGQLVALAAHPALGSFWGVLVALDGIAGGVMVYLVARRLGASTPASAIAGLLWATCPAREWPLSLTLAPTFLIPAFCWGMLGSVLGQASLAHVVGRASLALPVVGQSVIGQSVLGRSVLGQASLAQMERPSMALTIAGASLLLAAVFAPAEAIAMIAIGAALTLADSNTRDLLRLDVLFWVPWVVAAFAYVLIFSQRVAAELGASGALLGSPDTIRGLAGDGSPPWEAAVPASMLAPLFAAEHHAGVVLALCISPGIALISLALAFAILRPGAPRYAIAKAAALGLVFSLYAALPSQWNGVALPTPAAALAALVPGFAGIAQAGLGISVFCTLLGALALDALFAQPARPWRIVGAGFVALAIVISVLPMGPGSSRVNASPTIAAEMWAAENANGGSIAYYPMVDAASPRGAELAYVESTAKANVIDIHLSAADRASLSDISAPGVATRLRARGVRMVIVEERAYGDPLVTPALASWVWLPGDLRTARAQMPQVPNELSPIQAFDDGAIVVYTL
jgi:hypothetical protein